MRSSLETASHRPSLSRVPVEGCKGVKRVTLSPDKFFLFRFCEIRHPRRFDLRDNAKHECLPFARRAETWLEIQISRGITGTDGRKTRRNVNECVDQLCMPPASARRDDSDRRHFHLQPLFQFSGISFMGNDISNTILRTHEKANFRCTLGNVHFDTYFIYKINIFFYIEWIFIR